MDIIKHLRIVDLRTLYYILPGNVTESEIVSIASEHCTIVGGLFTPKSQNIVNTAFNVLCRELLLTLFSANLESSNGIDITQFQQATQCSKDIAENIIKQVPIKINFNR